MTDATPQGTVEQYIEQIKTELQSIEGDLAALREQLRRSREIVERRNQTEFLLAYA